MSHAHWRTPYLTLDAYVINMLSLFCFTLSLSSPPPTPTITHHLQPPLHITFRHHSTPPTLASHHLPPSLITSNPHFTSPPTIAHHLQPSLHITSHHRSSPPTLTSHHLPSLPSSHSAATCFFIALYNISLHRSRMSLPVGSARTTPLILLDIILPEAPDTSPLTD